MPICDHEEADTRIIVHLQDALDIRCTSCLISIVGNKVVGILIGKFHSLASQHEEAVVWVAFGTGNNCNYLCVNDI